MNDKVERYSADVDFVNRSERRMVVLAGDHDRAVAELRAELETIKAQQASAAQSAHHCSNCLGVQPESCMFAQSAPAGEREAFRAEYDAIGQRHTSTNREIALRMFQAGATWQRTQSAGVPDTAELQRVIYNADYNAKRMLDADSFWWSEIATIRVEFERFMRSLSAAPAQPAARKYGSYTTQPGEAVSGIALRQLKDESRWVEIRDLNAHAFPDIGPHDYYPVGTVLTMPAAQDQGEVQRLREALRDTARWIERLPVPTQGAIRQIERIDAALAAITGQEVKHDA